MSAISFLLEVIPNQQKWVLFIVVSVLHFTEKWIVKLLDANNQWVKCNTCLYFTSVVNMLYAHHAALCKCTFFNCSVLNSAE